MYSNYIYFIFLCGLVLFSSCVGEETLNFTEPQPKGKKDLTEIKKNFIGKYQSLNDSSVFLIVDKKEIRSHEHLDISRFSKEEFDSLGKYEVKDGDLYELGRKLKYPLRWDNDTAVVTHSYTESYFDFSEFQVLRHFKGKLFLNYGFDDGLWKVEILSLKDEVLTWYIIPINEEGLKNINKVIETIEEVKEYSRVTKDGEVINYTDTTIIAEDVVKRDFKKMMSSNIVKEIGRYKRIDN